MQRRSHWAAFAACALAALAVSAESADARRHRGQGAREVTVTGDNGRQVQDRRSRDRHSGTATHDRTTTFRDGSTRQVESERIRTGPGQYSASREVTTRNGETRVQSGDFTVTRTDTGRSVRGDITTSSHGQIDYARDVTNRNGVRDVNATATFEDGSTIRRTSRGSCANGVCTSSGAVTDRQGVTTTWEQTRARTDTGATLSRDTTFADGTTRSVDAERAGNGDGTGTLTRTVTGRNGETRSQTGDYVVTRTP
jgi:hypothetical protein